MMRRILVINHEQQNLHANIVYLRLSEFLISWSSSRLCYSVILLSDCRTFDYEELSYGIHVRVDLMLSIYLC